MSEQDLPVEGQDSNENLIKTGDEINLMEVEPALSKISIRAGWNAKSYDGNDIDMDISLIFLNPQDQTIKDEDFIFYNNASGYSGAVEHLGDSRHGAGAGDDEEIAIDLHGVPFDYVKVLILVSIYRGSELDQNLGDVSGGFIRIVNEDNNMQLARYELDSLFKGQTETAMVAGALERMGQSWIFKSKAEFAVGGLGEIASRHGLIIATQ